MLLGADCGTVRGKAGLGHDAIQEPAQEHCLGGKDLIKHLSLQGDSDIAQPG